MQEDTFQFEVQFEACQPEKRLLGMNMSTAIIIFLKTAVRQNGIPFEVSRFTPNAETRAALAEYAEMKRNPGAYKRYDSFDDVLYEVQKDA